MTEYTIVYHGEAAGEAVVRKEGLYYCIHCLSCYRNGMFRILVKGALGTVDLGTCIPQAGKLTLQTKIAAKKLGSIKGFEMIAKNEENTCWIPLVADTPIRSLNMIRHGYLMIKNGQIGLTVNRLGSLADGDVLPDR